MKKYITIAQWEELNREEQVEIGFIDDNTIKLPTISMLLEFIGESNNDYGFQYCDTTCEYTVWFGKNKEDLKKNWSHINLVDALWEACKYILKK